MDGVMQFVGLQPQYSDNCIQDHIGTAEFLSPRDFVSEHPKFASISTTTVGRKSGRRHMQDKQQVVNDKAEQRKHKQLAPNAASSAAIVLLGAAGVYSGIKGALQGFQLLRRRLLRQLILDVCPVLDSLGVKHWADFGSLLGMYREKDIILHDNDADVVVLNPDWDMLVLELRARLPQFRVYFVIPSEDTSIRWLRLSNGGIGILDLYGGFDRGGSSIEIPQGHGDLCDLPKSLALPCSRLNFRGRSISVPSDVVGVLRYRYGDDFMKPRYMDKGRDSVEQNKPYARLLSLLGKAGLCV